MTKSIEDQVAEMLADIQAQHQDQLEEDTEPVHVFFVRESELQVAMLDAASVEAAPVEPATPQPATPQIKKPANRRYTVLSFGIFTICVLISMLLFLIFIVPTIFIPVATVTITPTTKTLSTTATIQVHGRPLPILTLSQSATIPATGHRHQSARAGAGTVTFYNGLFTSQTVAAGTILTGQDGVQIITDQAATIPAGNPPIYGQATVSAHALNTGASGNILAYDINTACCATSVLAKNTAAFTGGQRVRDFIIVTKHDLEAAEAVIKSTLDTSERAALNAQVNEGEELITPACSPTTTSNHRIGEEAKDVTVTVSETCSSIAYVAHDVYQDTTQLIQMDATKRLGANYSLMGGLQVSIKRATIADQARGLATLTIQADATFVYQITPGIQHQLIKLIAGKPKQQALALLLQSPGIAGAQISVKGGNRTLPSDPGRTTIIVVYRSA
jgi:hypothetical protein